MTSMDLGDGGTFLGLDAEGLGAMIAIVSGAQTGTHSLQRNQAQPAGPAGSEQECGVGGLATLFLGRAGVICLFVWLLGAHAKALGRAVDSYSEDKRVWCR
jgi:hypothetical protein